MVDNVSRVQQQYNDIDINITDTTRHEVLDDIAVDETSSPRWPLEMNMNMTDISISQECIGGGYGQDDGGGEMNFIASPPIFESTQLVSTTDLFPEVTSPVAGAMDDQLLPDAAIGNINVLCKLEDTTIPAAIEMDTSTISTSDRSMGCALDSMVKAPVPRRRMGMLDDYECSEVAQKKKVQKPPTTAGITLDNLKAVFGLERPEAEKRLGLKRTTFSNLSRYYGISKWPFRTIRDASNRKQANERLLQDSNLSKEKRKKLIKQQVDLQGVINLMYSDPSQSKDSNTLAVLMNIVSS